MNEASRRSPSRDRLEASRRAFEDRFSEVRGSIRSEVGFAPRRKGMVLLLVVGAAGFAVALALRARLSRPALEG